MPLPPIPLLVLDTETTGFLPRVHRVIEFAAVRFEEGKNVATYEQLIETTDEIPLHVQILTNISPDELKGKPRFSDIVPVIQKLLTPDTIIAGQNILFDLGMLKGEGLDLTSHPWIDTSMLASIVFPELKSYALGYLATALKLHHEQRHRALSDVQATIGVLEQCWQRLTELPDPLRIRIQSLAKNGPEGYQRLFASLPATKKKRANPHWLAHERSRIAPAHTHVRPLKIAPVQAKPAVECLEESLDPSFLSSYLLGLTALAGTHLVAVKNLEATLRRVPLPERTTVLYPPDSIPHEGSRDAFLAQEAFTADELTLAIKLALYEPSVRSLLPIHGEEYAVWSGKLASTREGSAYRTQLQNLRGLIVTDHFELLRLLEESGETAVLDSACHIAIDDASMLEDTATAAYGWSVPTRSLRAASAGHTLLTKLTDLTELWMEKTRANTDVKYLTTVDVQTKEATGLKSLLSEILASPLPTQVTVILQDLECILDPQNLAGRISWIELLPNSNLLLKSVPEDVSLLLKEKLYACYATTLIIPKGGRGALKPIVPARTETVAVPTPSSGAPLPTFRFAEHWSMEEFLTRAESKSVLLLGSKRAIEDLYVQYCRALDERGITLICQGLSGGQSRMQAEFAAASSPAILVVTPWTYETLELPENTVDQLVLATLPFDHPAHAIFGKRAERFTDGFNGYSLPRLKNRLFRLIRTFCRHRTAIGGVTVTDDRLRTKRYGLELEKYLISLLEAKEPIQLTSDEKPKQMPLL